MSIHNMWIQSITINYNADKSCEFLMVHDGSGYGNGSVK